jgi:hypothetical protein
VVYTAQPFSRAPRGDTESSKRQDQTEVEAPRLRRGHLETVGTDESLGSKALKRRLQAIASKDMTRCVRRPVR